MVPNWSIIKEINAGDKSRFLVSDNYMKEAVDRGWYDPASGKPFIWQEAYSRCLRNTPPAVSGFSTAPLCLA